MSCVYGDSHYNTCPLSFLTENAVNYNIILIHYMHTCMYTVYVARYIVVGTVHAVCMVSTVTSTPISTLFHIHVHTQSLGSTKSVFMYSYVHCICTHTLSMSMYVEVLILYLQLIIDAILITLSTSTIQLV